jgi:hypothetical protein
MSAPTDRPIIFLDVDGPLIPFGGTGRRYPAADPGPGAHPLLPRLDPAGRPFIWIDDEITAADRRWVAARHRGRALLHRIDPRTGLTDADFATMARWPAPGGR